MRYFEQWPTWGLQHWPIIWTALIVLALTALLFYPVCIFLFYGWHRRAVEISNILDEEAKKLYLSIFHPHLDSTKFDEFYHDWYGRKYFVIPIVFLGAVAAVESYFIAQALQELIGADRTSKDFSVAVAAASSKN